jgi:uncharacterized membrane protein
MGQDGMDTTLQNKTKDTTRPGSRRIASIDWMRGIVMILMMVDHVSMAFNRHHFSSDSAGTFSVDKLPLAAGFLTRWITHICAPTFVFLAGTALAISVQRQIAKGASAWSIDKKNLLRGLFILLLDPTVVSFFSWRLTFQVLYAIGLSMMLMTWLRRLPSFVLLTLALGWIVWGEWITGMVWDPAQGNPSIPVALTMAMYYSKYFRISYPVLPWLSYMCLGWVFGRYLTEYTSGKIKHPSPQTILLLGGIFGVALFAVVRTLNSYGNMFLLRTDDSWMQFLLVSKYPPSLAFSGLELGLMCLMMGILIVFEPLVGVRQNGLLLVLGQTAMLYYLVHRIVLEGLAQFCSLRGTLGLIETYIISVLFVALLYPVCLWYRAYKKAHPGGWRQFI